jgi:hypothetical protein
MADQRDTAAIISLTTAVEKLTASMAENSKQIALSTQQVAYLQESVNKAHTNHDEHLVMFERRIPPLEHGETLNVYVRWAVGVMALSLASMAAISVSDRWHEEVVRRASEEIRRLP